MGDPGEGNLGAWTVLHSADSDAAPVGDPAVAAGDVDGHLLGAGHDRPNGSSGGGVNEGVGREASQGLYSFHLENISNSGLAFRGFFLFSVFQSERPTGNRDKNPSSLAHIVVAFYRKVGPGDAFLSI